jgi:hypothetical protein
LDKDKKILPGTNTLLFHVGALMAKKKGFKRCQLVSMVNARKLFFFFITDAFS